MKFPEVDENGWTYSALEVDKWREALRKRAQEVADGPPNISSNDRDLDFFNCVDFIEELLKEWLK